jgi:hypothetical protein
MKNRPETDAQKITEMMTHLETAKNDLIKSYESGIGLASKSELVAAAADFCKDMCIALNQAITAFDNNIESEGYTSTITIQRLGKEAKAHKMYIKTSLIKEQNDD